MKKLLVISLLFVSMLFDMNQLFAQGGPPPPPPDDHGSNNNQPPGGGAPNSHELIILFSFSIAYGAKKTYGYFKAVKE